MRPDPMHRPWKYPKKDNASQYSVRAIDLGTIFVLHSCEYRIFYIFAIYYWHKTTFSFEQGMPKHGKRGIPPSYPNRGYGK